MTERRLTKPVVHHSWVVVANAARARCFERDPDNGALRELSSFVHPESRQKGTELADDRDGRALKGQASTAFVPHTDPHAREHHAFAAELARHLEAESLAHHFDDLAVLASAPFLGELRAELGPAAQRVLAASVALDLTTFHGRDLEERVTQALGTVH